MSCFDRAGMMVLGDGILMGEYSRVKAAFFSMLLEFGVDLD